MIRLLFAAAVILATATPAAAQLYLVDDTTGRITAYTEQASPAAVAGSTWVAGSTINPSDPRAITGGTWDGTTWTPPAPPSAAATIAMRRATLARLVVRNWLRFVTVELQADDMVRIESQTEALTRALLLDANLSDDATYAVILAEAQTSGGSFLRYAGTQWYAGATGYYLPPLFPDGNWRLRTIHGAIEDGTATDESTPGVRQAAIRGNTDAALNWPIELHRLASP